MVFVIAYRQKKQISPPNQTQKRPNQLMVNNPNKPQRGVIFVDKRTQQIPQKPQRGDIVFVIAYRQQKQIYLPKQTCRWCKRLGIDNSRNAKHILQIITYRLQ